MTSLMILFVVTPLGSLVPNFVIRVLDCGCVDHDYIRGGSVRPCSLSVVFEADKLWVFWAL